MAIQDVCRRLRPIRRARAISATAGRFGSDQPHPGTSPRPSAAGCSAQARGWLD
jgi:hypothetical protein